MKLVFVTHDKIGPVPNEVFAGNPMFYHLIQWINENQAKLNIKKAELLYTDDTKFADRLSDYNTIISLDGQATEALALLGSLYYELPGGDPGKRLEKLTNFLED